MGTFLRLTGEISGGQHGGEDGSLKETRREETGREEEGREFRGLDLVGHLSPPVLLTSAYLQLPPGVELLQTFHRLLSVHAGGHGGAVLGRRHGCQSPQQTQSEDLRRAETLTEIQGCFSASAAVIRLDGLMVSILLMRSLASGVTVSHSGEGNCEEEQRHLSGLLSPLQSKDVALI